jgi:hypothetical protein
VNGREQEYIRRKEQKKSKQTQHVLGSLSRIDSASCLEAVHHASRLYAACPYIPVSTYTTSLLFVHLPTSIILPSTLHVLPSIHWLPKWIFSFNPEPRPFVFQVLAISKRRALPLSTLVAFHKSWSIAVDIRRTTSRSTPSTDSLDLRWYRSTGRKEGCMGTARRDAENAEQHRRHPRELIAS